MSFAETCRAMLHVDKHMWFELGISYVVYHMDGECDVHVVDENDYRFSEMLIGCGVWITPIKEVGCYCI